MSHTEAIKEGKYFRTMVNSCVIHDDDAERSWVCSTLRQLLKKNKNRVAPNRNIARLTTLNSSHSKNNSFVIDPSTTIPATNLSRVSRASVKVRLPCTKGWFFSALLPFFDLPYRRAHVCSSLETSSTNPISFGRY